MVKGLGGIVSADFVRGHVDILVTDLTGSEKYYAAVADGIPIVKPDYILACKKHASPSTALSSSSSAGAEIRYPRTKNYLLEPLAGCIITITDFVGHDRRRLRDMVEGNGAIFYSVMNDHVTHLIAASDKNTPKTLFALKRPHIHIVNEQWLHQCGQERVRLKEHHFKILPPETDADAMSQLQQREQESKLQHQQKVQQESDHRDGGNNVDNSDTLSDNLREDYEMKKESDRRRDNDSNKYSTESKRRASDVINNKHIPSASSSPRHSCGGANEGTHSQTTAPQYTIDPSEAEDLNYLDCVNLVFVGFENDARARSEAFYYARVAHAKTLPLLVSTVTHVVVHQPSEKARKTIFDFVPTHVHVVTFEWLKQCFKTRSWVDENDYLLTHAKREGESIAHQSEENNGEAKSTNDLNGDSWQTKSSNGFQSQADQVALNTLVDLPFTAKTFFVDHLVDRADDVRKSISQFGGLCIDEDSRLEAEFHIVPSIITADQAPQPRAETMVTLHWLKECQTRNKIVDPDESPILFQPYTKNGASNANAMSQSIVPKGNVVVASISAIYGREKAEIIHILACLGAEFSPRLLSHVDFLIIGREMSARKGEKLNYALNRNIQVVYEEWIRDCIAAGRLVSPKPYLHAQCREQLKAKIEQQRQHGKVKRESECNGKNAIVSQQQEVSHSPSSHTVDKVEIDQSPKKSPTDVSDTAEFAKTFKSFDIVKTEKKVDDVVEDSVDAETQIDTLNEDHQGATLQEDRISQRQCQKQQQQQQQRQQPQRRRQQQHSQNEENEFTRSVEDLIESNSASNDHVLSFDDEMSTAASAGTNQVSQIMHFRQRTAQHLLHGKTHDVQHERFQVIDSNILSSADPVKLERARQYQEMIANSKILSSTRPHPRDENEIESQVFGYDMRAPKTQIMQKLKSERKRVFMVSGFKGTEERSKLRKGLETLGGEYCERFNSSCTHLIIASPSKTEKVLCSLAAQLWILRAEFIYDSVKQGRWLNEEPYEWTEDAYRNCGVTVTEKNAQLSRCIRQLRLSERRPLKDWRVLLMKGEHMKGFRNILEAGGANAVYTAKSAEEMEHVLSNDTMLPITHIIQTGSTQSCKEQFPPIRKYLERYPEIPFVKTDYIMEFLIDDNADWRQHVASLDFRRKEKRRPRPEDDDNVHNMEHTEVKARKFR